jgi:hypothetical protein
VPLNIAKTIDPIEINRIANNFSELLDAKLLLPIVEKVSII